MIVSHRHRFLFIHIPRTAGTSLSNWLLAHFGNDLYQIHDQHARWCDLSEQEQEQYASYFKFSVVRHPFDRLLSWYQLVNPEATCLHQFFDSQHRFPLNQTEFLSNAAGEVMADLVLRYENLNHDLVQLAHQLGKPPSTLPYINATQNARFSPDPQTESQLKERCAADLAQFTWYN